MIVALVCFNARCEAFQHGLRRIVSANRNACIKVWPFATIADSIHALDKHYHLFCEKQDVTAAMTKLGSSVTFSMSCLYVHKYSHLLLQKNKAGCRQVISADHFCCR